MMTMMIRSLSSFMAITNTLAATPKDSKVLVHIPFQIHDPEGFDHVKADFGFGSILNDFQSISSYVYYVDEVFCYPSTNHSAGHPTLEPGTSWKTPFILLINGGGACSHVTKVRNAQMVGAAAVILAQPQCSCSDTNCTATFLHDTPPNCEDDAYVSTVLINDGSAEDISIPSFYLMKTISEKIKDQLRQNQPVMMELQWGMTDTFMNDDTNTDHDTVEIQFWSSAYDPHVRIETYTDLRTIASAFSENHISFVPQYNILDGHRWNCLNTATDDSPCDHLCTNNGRYCTNHAIDLTGRAILNETLRQTCIFQHSKANDDPKKGANKHDMYWEYVLYHKKECSKYPNTFTDPKCISDAMKQANIDKKTIDTCMDTAGGLDGDVQNTFFDTAVAEKHQEGIVTIPALVFNNHVLHRASAYLLFEVICNEYWMSNVRVVPDICIKCSSCPNTVGCVENHGKCTEFNNHERYIMPDDKDHAHPSPASTKKKSHFWSRLGWMLFFGCAFGGAYYYYETHIKDARRSGSRPLMNDYLHLNVDG